MDDLNEETPVDLRSSITARVTAELSSFLDHTDVPEIEKRETTVLQPQKYQKHHHAWQSIKHLDLLDALDPFDFDDDPSDDESKRL